jgi:peptidyl-prolyl cis-trans isomerase B (cyclophilin B)
MHRNLLIITMVLTLCFTCPALADNNPPAKQTESKPQVKMETSKGTIIIELNTQKAPITSDNFIAYVKSGFYDNTIFHRVIRNFMIQGGGFTEDMQQKSNRPPIQNEADNGLKNNNGTIAMARTNDPHSATSQFFINVKDNTPLNHRSKTGQSWGYCVFGRVIKGMEVVRAIENVATGVKAGHRDVPLKPVMIKRMTMINMVSGAAPNKSN